MKDVGILQPKHFMDWKRKNNILKVHVPPAKIIISPQLNVIRAKARRKLFSKKEIYGLAGMHVCVNDSKGIYLSGGWGLGGPALVSVCEDLHELGATEFYLIGVAGRLTEEMKVGDIAIATTAIREEGTSYHYLDERAGDEVAHTFGMGIDALSSSLSARQAKFVTTDAPYRETVEKYKKWVSKGASLVEMETASLYAFGTFHNVRTVSIGIGLDSLAGGKWNIPEGHTDLEKKLGIIIDDLTKLL